MASREGSVAASSAKTWVSIMPVTSLLCSLLALSLGQQSDRAPKKETHKIDPKEYRACGVTTLYIACQIIGVQADLPTIRASVQPAEDGSSSLEELHDAMRALGLFPVAAKLRIDHDSLSALPSPAIIHARTLEGQPGGNHFVVYLGHTGKGTVVLLDPPKTPEEVTEDRFLKLWTGYVLVPCRTKGEAATVTASLESAWDWWSEPLFWSFCVLIIVLLKCIKPLMTAGRKAA